MGSKEMGSSSFLCSSRWDFLIWRKEMYSVFSFLSGYFLLQTRFDEDLHLKKLLHEVAERFIAAVEKSAKAPLQMGFFINYNAEDIFRQTNESILRYQKGEPISVLDGVPVAIKDEIDCLPYPTTGGTKWLHKQRPCTDDARCVTRLRLCGAILVGKTNMHEFGAGTSGINPHYGATRNPYDINRIAGGSSSGSAAVVQGCVMWPLVSTVEILAGTVEDAMIVYAAISGQIPSHHPSNMPIVAVSQYSLMKKMVCSRLYASADLHEPRL